MGGGVGWGVGVGDWMASKPFFSGSAQHRPPCSTGASIERHVYIPTRVIWDHAYGQNRIVNTAFFVVPRTPCCIGAVHKPQAQRPRGLLHSVLRSGGPKETPTIYRLVACGPRCCDSYSPLLCALVSLSSTIMPAIGFYETRWPSRLLRVSWRTRQACCPAALTACLQGSSIF